VGLAFGDLDQRARDAVGFAADSHVWLLVQVTDKPVAKHRKRVHNEDSSLFDGRLPNTLSHCFYHRVSKTKSADKVNALDGARRAVK
jgi:hypothetical protein